MDIVKIVAEKTGVTEDQARGGLGLLLNLLKSQLDEATYSKVIGFIPGSAEMLAAAPEAGGIMGAIGGMIGGDTGEMAKVAQGFSDLGIDATKIPQFMGVVADTASENGATEISDAIRTAAP